ncbi:MAG: alanine racemase [Proteobacteria bacterium]|nr:amino acid deaminase/aldolase [Desulfobacula sp.]MBU4129641.1 alanine racemase [Pseudomonadota bacterium]
MTPHWNAAYETYKPLFKGYRFPLAFVDLDKFDHNIAYVAKTQQDTGKTIRVASKSIRSLELIRRVFEKGGGAYRGVLAFTMEEASFLIDNGLDDIIVAYPSVQAGDLDIFTQKTRDGATLSLVVDCPDHLAALSKAGQKAGIILNLCLDIDMSYRPLGRLAHLGVRRSPVHSMDQALELARAARKLSGVRITAVMGYEAQIASMNDRVPAQFIKNRLVRGFKNQSVKELTRRRQQIVDSLRAEGLEISVVNGGGSGSLVSTGRDDSVTEVTAGSAFFAPGLFRYFHEVAFEPAAFFGLQVTRIPKQGMITCQGGGYVGSGEVNANRLPWPVMPQGLQYLSMEGAGEVQTPLILPENCPDIGLCDPVFFQHSKAGELCERFNHLYLVKENKIIGTTPTYRGQGHAFL